MASTKAKDFSKVSDQQLELIAQCFQALSDPTRLKMLKELKAGEKSVQELVEMFSCSQPNISRHLSILTASGLVTKAKRGSYVLYSVANPGIFQLCDHVCSHVQGVIQRYSAKSATD
jgi:DNA-binding transcriptional ArsR family regulator